VASQFSDTIIKMPVFINDHKKIKIPVFINGHKNTKKNVVEIIF